MSIYNIAVMIKKGRGWGKKGGGIGSRDPYCIITSLSQPRQKQKVNNLFHYRKISKKNDIVVL